MIVYLGTSPKSKEIDEVLKVKKIADTYKDSFREVGICFSYLELKSRGNIDEILNELRLRFTIKSEQPLMIRLVHPLTDEIYEVFNQLRKITVVKWDPSNPIPHPL